MRWLPLFGSRGPALEPPHVEPDWGRIGDGRPWRLERDVDFSGPVPAFRRSAEQAAALTGRYVLLARDRLYPDRFIWVQFVDGAIAPGEPCPCGGTRLIRLSGHLVRCRECAATLLVTLQIEDELEVRERTASRGAPTNTLASFSNVRLRRTDSDADATRYVGFGTDTAGAVTVLDVRVPLVHGAPVPDPDSPTGYVHEVVLELRAPVASADDREELAWDLEVP